MKVELTAQYQKQNISDSYEAYSRSFQLRSNFNLYLSSKLCLCSSGLHDKT